MISDGELLRRYVENNSEADFTELVRRHFDVVYFAALRRVGRNAHAADDVTQKVFTDLARKAKSLQDRSNLAGWLYTSTRFASADVVRGEQRRRNYEEKAHRMHEVDSTVAAEVERFEPLLDEVMDLLNEQDREAVLLHFFEGRSFVEVGSALSLSADAARMRVNRALERLRTAFARHGVTSTAAALGVVLASQSALAAPTSLAVQVATHAFSQTGSLSVAPSLAMRVIQGIKSHLFLTGIVGVLGLTLIVVATKPDFFRSPVSHPLAAAPLALTASLPTAPAENLSLTEAQITVGEEPLLEDSPAGGARQSHRFETMEEPEKNLLAMLWNQQRTAAPDRPARHRLKVGQGAPNFPGIAPLVDLGLIEQKDRDQNQISLTLVGLQFCKANEAAIEAHPVFANRPAKEAMVDVSLEETRLLKILWTASKTTSPAAGARVVLKIPPQSPVFEACAPLLAKGLVAIGPKTGGFYLTPAGRIFCAGHLPH